MAAQEPQVAQSQEVRFNFIAEEEMPLEWTCSFCDSRQKEFLGRNVKFVTDNSIIVHGDCAIAMKNLKAVFGPNRNRVGEICTVPRFPVEGGAVVYHPVSQVTLSKLSRKKSILTIFSEDPLIKQLVSPQHIILFTQTQKGSPAEGQTKKEIRTFLIGALS